MPASKTKTTTKERALAKQVVQVMAGAKTQCVPLKCTISGHPCLYLVTCDPMSCGGLECSTLKKV